MTEQPQPGPDYVQSLARGLSVIKAFDADHPRLTLSEVARRTGLTRAAARRFLLTLAELGYIGSDEREFSLRPRVLELGYAYLSGLSLPEVAMPHLERLSVRAHESASVAVLDSDEVVYVARVPTKRIMTVVIAIGTRFPAYATSLGRVLLAGQDPQWLDGYLAGVKLRPLTPHTIVDREELRAELDRVRRQGFALADQQLEEGLRSMAAPIRDASGAVVAGVNVSAHISRGSGQALHDELLPLLLDTAAAIEGDLADIGRATG
ncbi:MAG TPA: IclR family transcriptional regulator C-terminal domain-containing protein [Stackebrandtia sp.]|jgi:IclR family pca regulon transcriptional regulator|uniref:IclR family transcriptional regulator domain-containing protein n=1 Tax=Stackebrandtia sp. TaxID=2023065 RepID=UPI002D5FAA6D|nr:IclR family transcriptional regulator C-terminal domain-containing protein [Stackebrandtia sp.]HZE38786.1 IclR family transcriptional regulator C-terminal domain-containing protein [Stackebrandtia sp.]